MINRHHIADYTNIVFPADCLSEVISQYATANPAQTNYPYPQTHDCQPCVAVSKHRQRTEVKK
jgi:hypothetical protein